MSTLKVTTIQDASGGNTATINSMTPTADSLQGFRNRIINGDMRIDQRNAGASVSNTSNLTYTVDRWAIFGDQNSKFTAQQSSTAPAGFINSLLITSSSAFSVPSGEGYSLQQRIEGTNVTDLGWGTANARTVTLSFWVRSSLTGTFGGSVTNSAFNRSYPYTYTISTADTWEYKTVTIAGDTSGTWLTTTGTGLRLYFGLGVGSTLSGTAGAWAGSGFLSATGATSVVATNAATFYITGVQFEVGSVATPFERRDYGRELILCQRYYEKSYNISVVPGTASSDQGFELFCSAATTEYRSTRLKVNKRAESTVTIYNPNSGATGQARDFAADTNKTVTVSVIGETGFRTEIASTVVGNRTAYQWVASAEL
jgi:hypothetical protein